MRIVCISDTHGMERRVNMPHGDLLIHAGDLTSTGEVSMLEGFNAWLGRLPFRKKIVIPGNHDRTVPNDPEEAKKIMSNCDFLIDEMVEFEGLKIYGSPWTPWFGGHYWVYNAKRGPSIRGIWNRIPEDTDILVTHGPPFRILDSVPRTPEPQGCNELRAVVHKIGPKLHVFGHLHDNHGTKRVEGFETLFVNATTCNEDYNPVNRPIVINYDGEVMTPEDEER